MRFLEQGYEYYREMSRFEKKKPGNLAHQKHICGPNVGLSEEPDVVP